MPESENNPTGWTPPLDDVGAGEPIQDPAAEPDKVPEPTGNPAAPISETGPTPEDGEGVTPQQEVSTERGRTVRLVVAHVPTKDPAQAFAVKFYDGDALITVFRASEDQARQIYVQWTGERHRIQ